MKTHAKLVVVVTMAVTMAIMVAKTSAQIPPPALTITPLGTNEYSVTIANNIGMADYDLQWTPILDSPDYPWSFAAIGVPGGTNFLLDGEGYESAFFRAVLDTNAVPLWEQSDPNNPSSPILTVTIISPANGANLNQ